jgi:hypothetical protein
MFARSILTALALVAAHSHAATLIEIKTPEGQATVYRDGVRSRMDTGDGYMLMVVPKERQVMDMSAMLNTAPPTDSGDQPTLSFKKIGEGAAIAGYATTHYQFTTGGKACGSVLASGQALKDSGLADTFEIMQRMTARADALMAVFNTNADPCQRASTRFTHHLEKIGIPMRVTLADGQLLSEVVRIEKNARLPPDAFTVPADYQVQQTGQLLQQLPNLKEMMQNLPNLKELMQQR